MAQPVSDVAFTPAVKAQQEQRGSHAIGVVGRLERPGLNQKFGVVVRGTAPLDRRVGAFAIPRESIPELELGGRGLLGAAYEMLRFRDDYPKQVIRNAKAFARALHDQGLTVDGDASRDFTETHQVLLRTERGQGEFMSDLLEANNVITTITTIGSVFSR